MLSRRTLIKGIGPGLALASGTLPPVEAAEADKAKSVKDLAREMRDVAQEAFKVSMEFLIAPPAAPPDKPPGDRLKNDLDRAYLWARRCLEAELDLSTTRDERIQAIALHLDRMKRFEAVLKSLKDTEASGISRMHMLDVAYYRLEAETLLAKERAKAK